jgi:hypothetical protein
MMYFHLEHRCPSFGQRPGSVEPGLLIRALDVHLVEEQHVEVNVSVQGAAEMLDQRDRAGLGHFMGLPCSLDQMCEGGVVNNAFPCQRAKAA